MVEHEDEAIHRLRASDPATGSHPDLHRLRELIAHKAPASQGADRATAVDDELLRGPRLRAPWIAAAAVAALGMGAGGYAVGLQAQEDAPSVVADGDRQEAGAAAPGADDSAEHDASPAEGSALEGAGIEGVAGDSPMPGETEASMGGDSAMSGPAWDPGPVRLTAGEGLPGSPGTAEVRVLQSDVTPQEFVEDWVAATGFEGVPMTDSEAYLGPDFEGYTLVDTDEGLVIMASNEGGSLHFNYEDIYGNEYCAEMYLGVPEEDLQMMRDDWARSYGPDLPFPTPESCDPITGDRPTDDQAKAVASNFFTDAGVDVSGYTFNAFHDDGTSKMVMVDAQPSDGAGTGDLMLSATVGPDGVVNAYGSVGEMTSLGEYPVISAAEAVERYGTREFSMDYGVTIAEEYQMWTEEDWEEFQPPEYTLPENRPLAPGDKIPMLLKDKVVTGAELVRGTMWTQTSGSVEVPVWKLTTGDGTYYTVLALAEEALEFQAWE